MKVKSFAKIDLGYSVYKKQKNFTKHDFESIFILVENIYDDIEITKIEKILMMFITTMKPMKFMFIAV